MQGLIISVIVMDLLTFTGCGFFWYWYCKPNEMDGFNMNYASINNL